MKAAMKNARDALQLLLLFCLISTMSAAGAEKTAGPTQKKPETFEEPGSVVKIHQRPRKREYTLITDKGFHVKVTLCRKDVVRVKAVEKMQRISFPAVWGEYVRLKILSGIRGNKFASAAEFEVFRDLKAKPLPDKIVYLSDLKPTSSKGKYKYDKSVGGKAITVNDQTYKRGIGAMSGSELVYGLDGTWDRLSGHVGMDDEVGDAGSVMFRVYADGKLVFESPNQTGKSVKQLMDLNVKGVKTLRLVLLDGGDGSKDDHGDWIDARLILKGSK